MCTNRVKDMRIKNRNLTSCFNTVTPGESYVVDNRNNTVGSMGAWACQQLHHGRIHPYPASNSRYYCGAESLPRPEELVTWRNGAGCCFPLAKKNLPDLKVRMVNIINLMKLQLPNEHTYGLSDAHFDALFT